MVNSNTSQIYSRPHVVLLGAGASCATIPNGDKMVKNQCNGWFLQNLELMSC